MLTRYIPTIDGEETIIGGGTAGAPTRRAMLLSGLGLTAAGALTRTALASGNVTVSQLGQDALAAVNAATAGIASLSAMPATYNGNPVPPPPAGLLSALQQVQAAAQALTSVTSSGTTAQQFLAAVNALLPLATPYLAALGPYGYALVAAIVAIEALAPEIAQLTNQPAPATASAVLSNSPIPPMTAAQARAMYGAK